MKHKHKFVNCKKHFMGERWRPAGCTDSPGFCPSMSQKACCVPSKHRQCFSLLLFFSMLLGNLSIRAKGLYILHSKLLIGPHGAALHFSTDGIIGAQNETRGGVEEG